MTLVNFNAPNMITKLTTAIRIFPVVKIVDFTLLAPLDFVVAAVLSETLSRKCIGVEKLALPSYFVPLVRVAPITLMIIAFIIPSTPCEPPTDRKSVV